MYACVYVVYVCMYMSVCVWCVDFMCVCVRVYTCVCVHVCTYVRMRMYIVSLGSVALVDAHICVCVVHICTCVFLFVIYNVMYICMCV